jgi:hypothetical protein
MNQLKDLKANPISQSDNKINKHVKISQKLLVKAQPIDQVVS